MVTCKEEEMTKVNQEIMQQANHREDMHIVIVGHVDHGKSTIIGRLLADTGSLPEGKLEFVKETCRRNAKPFEYAFLLDALKDEQSQGITIDSARCFFKTNKRNYIIIDAPGHIEFLKNMVTGAARAEAALLVIDATEGIQENSKRHGYMLSLLGIKKVAVLINKMDLVDYRQEIFVEIKVEYTKFLNKIGVEPTCFVPVSGMQGDNIASKSEKMIWHDGVTVLDTLDSFEGEKPAEDKPFRMPVQGVYKFTRDGDNRRIIAGTVESGSVKVGDDVVFYPSGKTSRVKSIEAFNETKKDSIGTGHATGFTLADQIFVSRGEIATIAGQNKPGVTSRVRVNLFWLGRQPLIKEKSYLLKLGTAKIVAQLEEVVKVIDASNLAVTQKDQLDKHDVAECIFKLDRDIAFDPPDLLVQTSRFVLVDNYEISGGGIIEEALEDVHQSTREKIHLRNIKWEKGFVEAEERAERYNQKSTLVLVTGKKGMNRKQVAKSLEQKFFEEGKLVYYYSMGNLLYGVDADLKVEVKNNKTEHFRRLAEVANIMLEAGVILIVSVIELTKEDIRQLTMAVPYDKIEVIWLGEEIDTDVDLNLHIPETASIDKTVAKIKEYLQKKGIIFRPW
jgi:bifunctional enzyme CysN/CysC